MFDSHRVRKMQNFSQPPHNSHCTQRSLSEEMRARLPTTNKNAEEDGNIDVERNFNINGNDDDFDSSGAMKKKKSVSSSSLPSMMMVPKNPWLLLVLGILFGAFLPTFMKHKSVRIVHRHVKGAYKAHSEASKEYLKRYRETYLEEVKANVNNAETVMILESVVKEEEKKVEEELVKEEVGAVTREEGGDIAFKTLENGKHVCLPVIDEDFSELLFDEEGAAHASFVSRAECGWYNQLRNVGIEAASTLSSCVPDNFVFAIKANEYHWDMFMYGLQNVKSEKCFMDRLIILCLDDSTLSKCTDAGFKHCLSKPAKNLGASDFKTNEFNAIAWYTAKMALVFNSANLSVFTFDADILFFQVPNLAKVIESDPNAELFYQWDEVDYEKLYSSATFDEEREASIHHSVFNSGQMLWRPSEKVRKGILKAMVRAASKDVSELDQYHLEVSMKEVGANVAGLSYMYAANWVCSTRKQCLVKTNSQNWIDYHATWVVGLENKMEVLKMAQEGWKNVKKENLSDGKRNNDDGIDSIRAEKGGGGAFKTLENGNHVCLPLIYEDFSDLVSEEEMNESGTVMTRSECEWFARYIKVSIVASKMTSKCVPDDHVFSTLVNEHEWEVFTYAVQNVKSEKCLIDRLIILCLDGATALKCKYDGFTHCVQYVDTLRASDFMQNDFWRIGWLKTKMALALVSAKLTAFIHDSDVLFLKVPDMDRIIALDPTAEMFHQWEQLNYTALFLKSSFEEESEPVDVPHKGLNGGQIVYLPTEKVHQGLLLSLRKGKEWGTNKNRLDQELLMSAMDDVGVKRTGLSYKYNSYCSTRSFNREHEHLEEWITFHVNCAKGPGLKMLAMREVQEDWIKHKSG